MITPSLKWDDHINKLCSRAKKLLGYLFYRNVQLSFLCRLFTSMIWPILEYTCQVWDPYTVKNRQKIENIQKYALRICSGRWLVSYEELLDVFKLPTLASRREYLRIISLHQYHTQHSYFPPERLTQQSTSVATHSNIFHQFKVPFARTIQFQSFFLPRTLQLWKNLPTDILDNDCRSFKCILKRILL